MTRNSSGAPAILKGTRKLKEDSLSDFISQKQHPNYEPGEPKRVHLIPGLSDDSDTVKEVIKKVDANNVLNAPLINGINMDALEKELNRRKEYNKNILKLDKLHAQYRPKRGGALLRVKMYEGYESANMVVPYEGKVRIDRHKQAAEYVKDPFNFSNTAVVVATHPGDEYKAGMLVHIEQPVSFQQPESGMIVYANWFIHPSYPSPEFPYNKYESKFYGYIFIPSSAIIGIIEDAPENLEIVDTDNQGSQSSLVLS